MRTRDLAEQRERLSAATWSVLAESGVRGLTLRAVAARAGCTTGLVMHAFGDKQALLSHARELLHQRTKLRLDAAEASGAPPLEILREIMRLAASLTPQARDEARVWLSFVAEALSDDVLARQHVAGNRAFLARVERLVAACQRGTSTYRVQAASLVATVEGLNALAALDPERYDEDVQRSCIDDALARIGGGAAGGV